MPICGAFVTKYVGKGLERKEMSGTCPLDTGHDGDHVPPQLIHTGSVMVAEDQLAEVKTLIASLDLTTCEQGYRLQELVMTWGT